MDKSFFQKNKKVVILLAVIVGIILTALGFVIIGLSIILAILIFQSMSKKKASDESKITPEETINLNPGKVSFSEEPKIASEEVIDLNPEKEVINDESKIASEKVIDLNPEKTVFNEEPKITSEKVTNPNISKELVPLEKGNQFTSGKMETTTSKFMSYPEIRNIYNPENITSKFSRFHKKDDDRSKQITIQRPDYINPNNRGPKKSAANLYDEPELLPYLELQKKYVRLANIKNRTDAQNKELSQVEDDMENFLTNNKKMRVTTFAKKF